MTEEAWEATNVQLSNALSESLRLHGVRRHVSRCACGHVQKCAMRTALSFRIDLELSNGAMAHARAHVHGHVV